MYGVDARAIARILIASNCLFSFAEKQQGTMPSASRWATTWPWRFFVKMNGRLTAVSGAIKQNAPIERSIEEFGCRDLTTKTV
jgi:hypothetical protein